MFKKLGNAIKGNPVHHTTKPYPHFSTFADAIDAVNRSKQEPERHGKWPLHVSSVLDFCPRQHRLAEQSEIEFKRSIGTPNRLLWAIGKAMEKVNGEALIEAYGPERFYGAWLCLCKQTKTFGFGNNPFNQKCPHCKTSILFQYEEHVLTVDNLLTGRPDFLILNEQNKLTVIEHKSIKAEEFNKLEGPEIRHKLQAYYYLRMMQALKPLFDELGIEINLDWFSIIYASKGYKFFGSCVKEFRVNLKEQRQNFLQHYDDTFAQIEQLRLLDTLPERELCETSNCDRAKKCPVVTECFSQW